VAVFKDASNAEAAATELKANGTNANDIYISSERTATGSSTSEASTHREGGFIGWIKSIFGDNDQRDRQNYENAVQRGNILLSVDTADRDIDRVAEILDRHSPLDVHTEDAGTAARGSKVAGEQSKSIPVVEEDLNVGKRSVVRGGVRVYSRLTSQPVEETVRLREEKVRVERQPADRPVNEADLRSGQDQVIEVKEYAEEPVVSKQARVTEEVRVGKEATERTETIRDQVRRTDVNVENLDREKLRAASQPSGLDHNLDDDFRQDFSTRYGNTGQNYEAYSPAYRYGYEMAGDPRYQGRNFNEVESGLQTEYARRYPNSAWEKMKDSVRYGWDKVTGRTRAAAGSR
jgi:stress response protein YsnF